MTVICLDGGLGASSMGALWVRIMLFHARVQGGLRVRVVIIVGENAN